MMFQNGIDLILINEQIKVGKPNIIFSLKFDKFETKDTFPKLCIIEKLSWYY